MCGQSPLAFFQAGIDVGLSPLEFSHVDFCQTVPCCASETTQKQHIWILNSTQKYTQVLHEIYKKLYNFMVQMFEENLSIIYITTGCL